MGHFSLLYLLYLFAHFLFYFEGPLYLFPVLIYLSSMKYHDHILLQFTYLVQQDAYFIKICQLLQE